MTRNSTPAELRAAAEEKLKPLGSQRIQQKQALDQTTADIRPLVLRALACEVTHRRIQTLTGLSSGTIQSWKDQQQKEGT